MSIPEPLDEHPGGTAETRGGDRLADITVPPFAKGGLIPGPDAGDWNSPEDAVYDDEEGCACGPACPDSSGWDPETE